MKEGFHEGFHEDDDFVDFCADEGSAFDEDNVEHRTDLISLPCVLNRLSSVPSLVLHLTLVSNGFSRDTNSLVGSDMIKEGGVRLPLEHFANVS